MSPAEQFLKRSKEIGILDPRSGANQEIQYGEIRHARLRRERNGTFHFDGCAKSYLD